MVSSFCRYKDGTPFAASAAQAASFLPTIREL
jgi:hypothetical protein